MPYQYTQYLPDALPSHTLASIIPPRVGGMTLASTENFLSATSHEGRVRSLEIVGTGRDVTFMHRAASDDLLFRSMAEAHFPSAIVEAVPPEHDPLIPGPSEDAWTCTLTVEGEPYLPLRSYQSGDFRADHGADPMAAVIGAHTSLASHERMVTQILLDPLPADWSQKYRLLGFGGPGSHNHARAIEGRVGDYVNPELVRARIDDHAYRVEIRVTVLADRRRGSEERAQALLRPVIDAFRGFNHLQGSRIVAGEMRPHTGREDLLNFTEPERRRLFALFRRKPAIRSVIGLGEVASMWHMPTRADRSAATVKSYSTHLAPPREMRRLEGVYVGDSTAGPPMEVLFPEEMTRHHQLVIGPSGMGQSTLLEHIVAHKMRQKVQGESDETIIVVSPTSTLIESLLGLVPPGLEERVRLIDLADADRVPGINLLDVHIFPDRDRTCDMIVRIMRGRWKTWGPRMQNILEHTIKSLHDANRHAATPRDGQYTLLDGTRMLRDADFRKEVLERVDDVFLQRYWREQFDRMPSRLRSEAVGPVLTRIAFFASSGRARQVLGQRRSTLDIGAAIEVGDVILVNAGQDFLGPDVAELLGGTILAIVDGLIRAQEAKRKADRRSVYLVVDEMQTFPGADFQGMVADFRRVGGSLCLTTPSLSALDAMGSSLADRVLPNMDSLVVFQTSGSDAQRLAVELGIASVEDIVSLPAGRALVKATVAGRRLPVFSMRLRHAQEGETAMARAVRALMDGYTGSVEEVEERLTAEYGPARDVEPDPGDGYAGVDGGVPYLDTHPRDGGSAPGFDVENRPRGGRSRGGQPGYQRSEDRHGKRGSDGRTRTPRESNIQRFEEDV